MKYLTRFLGLLDKHDWLVAAPSLLIFFSLTPHDDPHWIIHTVIFTVCLWVMFLAINLAHLFLERAYGEEQDVG